MKKVFLLGLLSFVLIMISCKKDELGNALEKDKMALRTGDRGGGPGGNPGDGDGNGDGNLGTGDRDGNGSIKRINYDNDLKNLARVLSVGVRVNTNLSKLIKVEALKQFDGDVNVLVSSIKDMELVTGDGVTTVKQFLGGIYNQLGLTIETEGNDQGFGTSTQVGTGGDIITNPDDIIDYIVAVYPILQIAIPVHVGDWDEENYTPICTFIPEDSNEGEIDFLDGYLNDNHVLLDANNEPDNPVLVIGINERLGGPESILTSVPEVSIYLGANTVATGIALDWEVEEIEPDQNIIGYRVYRKGSNNNNFVAIGETLGYLNRVYYDNSVGVGGNYAYYVKAYNAIGESAASNIVQEDAPSSSVNVFDDFSALHFIEDQIELRWTYEDGQFINDVKLYEQVIGTDPEYQEIGTFPFSTFNYFDNDVQKGKRVNYKIQANTSATQPSNPMYDFVKVPFRDVSEPAPVRLKQISYDFSKRGQLEGWFRGAPEFRVSVIKGTSGGKGAVVQKGMVFNFPSFWAWPFPYMPTDRLIIDWSPSDWMEVLTFDVMEIDGGPDLDKVIDAAFDTKDPTKQNLLKEVVKVTINSILDNSDDPVGVKEHRYIDQEDAVLEFSTGGVEIDLDEE